MGVKIYNEADLEVVQKLKAAANADLKETVLSLDKIEEGSLNIADAVATMYEDNLNNSLNIADALATIYETILGGQAE
jgi:hypothetical protein